MPEQSANLFNPREQTWTEHFLWVDNSIRIAGLTPTGRETIDRLKMNRPSIVHARKRWADAGYHPRD